MATKKKTSPKKTSKKTPANAKGKKNKKAANPRQGGQGSAFLVLLIMVLLTVIVLMAGDYISPLKNKIFQPGKKTAAKKKENRNREIVIAPDKEEKADKKEEKKEPVKEVKKKEPEKAAAPKKVYAKIYFIRMDERTEKIFLSPLSRKVEESKKVEGALTELLKGLSGSEKRKGYLSAIPSSLRVRKVRVRNGIAEIDFNSVIGSGAGNILVSRIDQIVYTATQFKEVKAVQIMINGRRRSVLGSDGLSIGSPLHRRK